VPSLDLVLAPADQVVHVLQQLVPGHDARRGVGLHELGALGALGVGADLLAHVLADAGQLVLHLHTPHDVEDFGRHDRALLVALVRLQSRGLLVPSLDLVLAPADQVVHVLQQLVPGHDARRGVGLHELGALGALGVGADLLAHLLADSV